MFPIAPEGGVARTELRLDLTDSQRLTSGAIRARLASNVETVGFRTARERLGFDRQGDQVSVVNGIGHTVTRLVLRDEGRFYKLTSPLAPGSRAVMTTGNLQPAALLNNDVTAISRFGAMVASQPDGSYLAVLEHSPFWRPARTTWRYSAACTSSSVRESARRLERSEFVQMSQVLQEPFKTSRPHGVRAGDTATSEAEPKPARHACRSEAEPR